LQVAGIITIHNVVKLKAKERTPKDLVTEGKPNIGRLEIIVAKPDLVLYGQPSKYITPTLKAACLMEGIMRLHPFTDGNKRTSLYTATAYLQKEKIFLDMKLVESKFLVHVAANADKRTEEEIHKMILEIELYLSRRIK